MTTTLNDDDVRRRWYKTKTRLGKWGRRGGVGPHPEGNTQASQTHRGQKTERIRNVVDCKSGTQRAPRRGRIRQRQQQPGSATQRCRPNNPWWASFALVDILRRREAFFSCSTTWNLIVVNLSSQYDLLIHNTCLDNSQIGKGAGPRNFSSRRKSKEEEGRARRKREEEDEEEKEEEEQEREGYLAVYRRVYRSCMNKPHLICPLLKDATPTEENKEEDDMHHKYIPLPQKVNRDCCILEKRRAKQRLLAS